MLYRLNVFKRRENKYLLDTRATLSITSSHHHQVRLLSNDCLSSKKLNKKIFSSERPTAQVMMDGTYLQGSHTMTPKPGQPLGSSTSHSRGSQIQFSSDAPTRASTTNIATHWLLLSIVSLTSPVIHTVLNAIHI